MSKINDGGPAFPTDSEGQNGPNSFHYGGMTLRDYFAAKAMAGEASNNGLDGYDADETARMAYELADAMLAARSK